jgi:hypothetical protein
MPTGAVYAGRPTRWGNPFVVGHPHPDHGRPMSHDEAIALYRSRVAPLLDRPDHPGQLDELRGRDLVCWCRLDQACHADALLAAANA